MSGQVFQRKESPNTPPELDAILHPWVKAWFQSKFKAYSLPQLFGVMEIHSRKNTLISAPTGATKTLTAFLSILNELVDSADKGILKDKIYCVYISPLKALNEDIKVNLINPLKEIEEIAGKPLGIRVASRTGDTSQKERVQMLKRPPHILITTPESLAILLSSTKFSAHLKDVEWCVIDEIHAIADNKRGVHLSLSVERMAALASHMARVGLSATVAPLEEIAAYLVGQEPVLSDVMISDITSGQSAPAQSPDTDPEEEGERAIQAPKLVPLVKSFDPRPCVIIDVQFLKDMDLKVLSPVPDLIDTTFENSNRALYNLIHDLIKEHRTTLIFTNTRAATERVVDTMKDMFPKDYAENIGAHHGSLSKTSRHSIEDRLRKGELKCVVCSTSLELGIDIGFIDLVICLGSPKSVARALQRIGRSGHRLHDTTKGRIIVLDRDDLVECAVLLKSALEKKIDRVHIPTNCLDVLAQQLDGMALDKVWSEIEMFNLVRQSYCYKDLKREDFANVLSYLAGEFAELQDRYIYAKIWRNDGMVGRRGKMGRVTYMTNIGTIPEETYITVKVGDQHIGHLDEGFLEKLKPGDTFLLGGHTYQFQFARGMVAQVTSTTNRPPTVPSWFSEMLPLSYDLGIEIGRFRRLMFDKFNEGMSESDLIDFINHYLYVDRNGAVAIYTYFNEQFRYCKKMPTDRFILVEHYEGEELGSRVIFHTLFGRRVNDCLSRAMAFVISKAHNRDVEIGINDNGFYLSSKHRVNLVKAFDILKSEKLDLVMEHAINSSEVLRRRFRHCAARALMILRNYKGNKKSVGKQQVSSMILMKALERISKDFCILKEARREVLEDLMDIKRAKEVLKGIEDGQIQVEEIHTQIPSPFAFKIVLQGVMDIMRFEDRIEFLKRMHQMVMAKISLKEGRKN
ncbi:MAG: DEAD/DEAH box helicase [Nanoarchaeota archaeon]